MLIDRCAVLCEWRRDEQQDWVRVFPVTCVFEDCEAPSEKSCNAEHSSPVCNICKMLQMWRGGTLVRA